MTTYYFVRPIDSLFVRGNLAFGDSGEHGASVMPPPPSLFAGAFRSAILGRDSKALAQFTQHGRTDDPDLDRVLGTLDPESGKIVGKGTFRITMLTLAGQPTGSTVPEAIVPLPSDLLRLESGFASLIPGEPDPLVSCNGDLPCVAMLRSAKQEKPQGGVYLRQRGWIKHLEGTLPDARADTIKIGHVHTRDPRLGIGLNSDSRTVESDLGLIYTTEGHAFNPEDDPTMEPQSNDARNPFNETGFLVGLECGDGLLSASGFLRVGGDGRSAQYRRVEWQPSPVSLKTITRTRRFRLILNTPGLFVDGWRPSGITRDDAGFILRADGFSARLVCAAFGRREVVSGWNLFHWKLKNAERTVPAGSVYWFDEFEGDADKLAAWVAAGLWDKNMDNQRRAEGYNLATLAIWLE